MKMRRLPKVKICGITSLADAQLAVSHGADAIGYVLWESSARYIPAQQAALITRNIPPFISTVGVFVNPSVAQVKAAIQSHAIDTLQFHGDETEDFCQQFKMRYFKGVSLHHLDDWNIAEHQYQSAAALLVDAYAPVERGGTGRQANWSVIPPDRNKLLVLAGGINADIVAESIVTTQPYALDVSSGVEAAKGVKDSNKIAKFFATLSALI